MKNSEENMHVDIRALRVKPRLLLLATKCFSGLSLKIYCDEGTADLVLRVDEPSSCSYVITVYTNKLCKHSLFRSVLQQEPQAITCSPALSEERYNIYIKGVGE